MQILNELHKQTEMHRSMLRYHREGGVVLGWTYEQLGWKLDPKNPGVAL